MMKTMKMKMQRLRLIFNLNDLNPIWEEFLPHAQKCWQLQRECFTAGNCFDWWKSRFYDFFIGHGVNNRRDYKSFENFPEVWAKYGSLLQNKGRDSRDSAVNNKRDY